MLGYMLSGAGIMLVGVVVGYAIAKAAQAPPRG